MEYEKAPTKATSTTVEMRKPLGLKFFNDLTQADHGQKILKGRGRKNKLQLSAKLYCIPNAFSLSHNSITLFHKAPSLPPV